MTFARPRLQRLMTVLAMTLTVSCRESLPGPPRAVLSAAKGVEAGLVVSSQSLALGDTLVVLVRVVSGAEVRSAASFTARVSYDAARLAFAGEVLRDDGGARVINGEIPGDVRSAGIATGGFGGGDLVALRFVAKVAGPIGMLRLAIDQLHATDGEDLARVTIRATMVDAEVAQ